MSFSYDLIREGWIPCSTSASGQRELGLRDVVLEAHKLQEVQGDTPLVTAALLRLLLALLHRVYGPASAAAWGALWRAGRFDPEPLEAYLDRWRDRFDLFHPEHPFMQSADERVKPRPVVAMIHQLSSGGNPTLFDHSLESEALELGAAQAARYMLTAQSFGFAGLSGIKQKHTDGTCTRGVIFFVAGSSLFQTLMLNLPRYPASNVMPYSEADRPAWEVDDPTLPERGVPLGYLDYLTWPNRRVLLLPEQGAEGVIVRQATVAPALRLSTDVHDPMKLYSKGGALGWKILRFNEERALWRDSSALFRLRRGEAQQQGNHQPPAALEWFYRLAAGRHRVLPRAEAAQVRRMTALGMANSQARAYFYRHEAVPIALAYIEDEELVGCLQDLLDDSEAVRNQLWGAANTLAGLLIVPEEREGVHKPHKDDVNAVTEQWAIERDYWARLEIPFGEAMRDLPDDPDDVILAWRRTLRRTAWRALERVTRSLEQDAASLKAVVRAEGQLGAGLAKVLPKE